MNTSIYLEHANISVKDLDGAIRFFQTAFPHFHVRGQGVGNGRKWVHLGDEINYMALNSEGKEQGIHKNYDSSGINHLGFVVNDATGLAERLLAAGFERSYPEQLEEYRIREYFYDKDGNEFEFAEYLSEDPSERNAYDA